MASDIARWVRDMVSHNLNSSSLCLIIERISEEGEWLIERGLSFVILISEDIYCFSTVSRRLAWNPRDQ